MVITIYSENLKKEKKTLWHQLMSDLGFESCMVKQTNKQNGLFLKCLTFFVFYWKANFFIDLSLLEHTKRIPVIKEKRNIFHQIKKDWI